MGEETGRTEAQQRLSARKKTEAVLRVLRGESLDVVSREMGVTAGMLSDWRDQFIATGTEVLKKRHPSATSLIHQRRTRLPTA